MKFFHLSDLHIGIKLKNQDFYEDQQYIFDQMIRIMRSEAPDAVVIAGDIYDTSDPSAEAVDLFNRFMEELTCALPEAVIMVISGNHDSASRIDLYRDILKGQQLYMIGQPPQKESEWIEKVTLTDQYGPVNFYLLPFVKPFMMRPLLGTDENDHTFSYDETLRRLLEREEIDQSQRNVLVSHQFYLPAGKDPTEIERADSERVTVGNLDQVCADVLDRFDYAALGHIHRFMQVGEGNSYYCGTPLAYSFSEAGQEKRMLMVELGEKTGENCEVQVTQIPLTPMRQVRKIEGSLQDVLAQACDDYVSVTLTDPADSGALDLLPNLRRAFPHLLEYNWAVSGAEVQSYESTPVGGMDPFELCCAFAPDLSDEERDLLRDVVNTVWEET